MGSVASQNSSVLSVKTNHGFEGGLIHTELIGEAFLGDWLKLFYLFLWSNFIFYHEMFSKAINT